MRLAMWMAGTSPAMTASIDPITLYIASEKTPLENECPIDRRLCGCTEPPRHCRVEARGQRGSGTMDYMGLILFCWIVIGSAAAMGFVAMS